MGRLKAFGDPKPYPTPVSITWLRHTCSSCGHFNGKSSYEKLRELHSVLAISINSAYHRFPSPTPPPAAASSSAAVAMRWRRRGRMHASCVLTVTTI